MSLILGNRTTDDGRVAVVPFDLDIVMRSGLLVQGGSGSGKSRTLRRIAEQVSGKVQIVIIDPEGEFASLRERFDFLLAGAGGEAPIGVGSAGLLSRRILEIKASAICDLSELRQPERHRWVRLFFESLMEAPRALRHDVLFLIDEEHLYAPEPGYGDSEAAQAVIDFATRGRKRGFGHVGATQRLAALRKPVLAELKNALIGQTFFADDQDRAAKTLGVPRSEMVEFRKTLRHLEPGHFFALGRALSVDRILVHVGPVQTTHPEPGGQRQAVPPPAPAKIKRLLAELRDLPAEAEAEAKSLIDLRRQVAELRAKLAAAPVAAPPVIKTETVTVQVIDKEDVARLERVVEKLDKMRDAMAQAQQVVVSAAGTLSEELRKARAPVPVLRPVPVSRSSSPSPSPSPVSNGDTKLTGKANTMLRVLAANPTTGLSRAAVAIRSVISPSSGTFSNYVSDLHAAGMITKEGACLRITSDGARQAENIGGLLKPSTEELVAAWSPKFTGKAREMFKVLVDARGAVVSRSALADSVGISDSSGTFSNYISDLHSVGILTKIGRDDVAASQELFA